LERFCPKFATVLCNSWDPTQNIHCTLRGRLTRSWTARSAPISND
jgi:hypothetical protein